jgi:transglutaminase-like putative cysteine protease
MLYRITHTTTYHYTEPVSLCQNLAHLTPRNTPTQHCRHSEVSIEPEPAVVSDRIDYFGNCATFFTVQEPHRNLIATASHLVDVARPIPPAPEATLPWELVAARLIDDLSRDVLDASQFVCDSRYARQSDELAEYARGSFAAGRPILEATLDLAARIHEEFQYDPSATTVATSLEEMFAQRRGVCQDFAHLQIACMRSLGLSARYVSGYLSTEPPPGCVPLVGSDATHAWLSVFCPEAGWVDVDPTNNQIPGDKHVLLAWGRDYDDVSPIKGIVLGGGHHSVRVAVDVRALVQAELPTGGA